MKKTFFHILINILIILFSLLQPLVAQDTLTSLAFKKNRSVERYPFFYRPDLSYQLVQQFRLIQQANSGDALAQHELGLRLLFGDGIAADTPSAVLWIKRAALKKLSAAQYNYALMLLNGIGVEWNPFEAFYFINIAASQNFAPAQYALAFFYIDDLIVPRNWRQAFYWLYKAKSNGYNIDEQVLNFVEKNTPSSYKDSLLNDLMTSNENPPSNNLDDYSYSHYHDSSINGIAALSFIDFDASENPPEINERILINDLFSIDILNDTLRNAIKNLEDLVNKTGVEYFLSTAKYDVPEILTILGYLYKEGKVLEKNGIKALEYLIQAIRYDSPRAPFILIDILKDKSLIQSLKNQINTDDKSIKFVWYGLTRFGFISVLLLKDAYNLLNEAAKDGHIYSINELALNYFVGNYFQRDKQLAIKLWKYSESLGSPEATLRIILSDVFDEQKNLEEKVFNELFNFETNGSVLAQAAIGFCYEKGRGTKLNKALAAKYYRRAAQRGNRFAFERLKNLYNSVRPVSREFKDQ